MFQRHYYEIVPRKKTISCAFLNLVLVQSHEGLELNQNSCLGKT